MRNRRTAKLSLPDAKLVALNRALKKSVKQLKSQLATAGHKAETMERLYVDAEAHATQAIERKREVQRLYAELKKETSVTPTEMILRYFKFDHLPANLQAVSKPFCEMAETIAAGPTSGPETTTCLRKLLEAKDCAVRAHLNEQVAANN